MPQLFELIWVLLPLFYAVLVIISLVKKIFGSKLNIPIKDYIVQLVFCVVGFLISIFIVRSDSFLLVVTYYPLSLIPAEVYKWVLYPVVLVLSSLIVDRRSAGDPKRKMFKIK